MAEYAWAQETNYGWELELRVQPGARRSEVVGELGDTLKVRVAAPANDGKANAELVRLLARQLDVPRRAVEVVRGAHSRTKTVRVTGVVDLSRLSNAESR